MTERERGRERSKPSDNSKNDDERKMTSNENETMDRPTPQWEALSHEQINTLLDLSIDQVQLQFEDILNFKNSQTCLKEVALLDYFVGGFWWAKEMGFTCQQISFILALLHLLLNNVRDKNMSFVDNFTEFSKLLLDTRKSTSSEMDLNPLFEVDQIQSITDYFKNSLFQHYRLYEFLFFHPSEQQHLGMERTIEVIDSANFVAPLEEGMPTDVYFNYSAPAPVEQPDEVCSESRSELTQTTEEQQEEGTGEAGAKEKEDESFETYTTEEVQVVLGEMAREMLAGLRADITDKLRAQEESYSARMERLEKTAFK